MKQIWSDLWRHVRLDFEVKPYLLTTLFLGVLIFCNYYFELETNFQAKLTPWQYLLFYLVFFPAIYFTSLFIKSGARLFANREFMLVSSFFLVIISVNTGFLFYQDWFDGLELYERTYLRNITLNSMGLILSMTPLFLFWIFFDRKHQDSFYGLSLRNHNFKPYLILLICMVPLITIAAQQSDFQSSYPVFKPWKYKEVYSLSLNQMTALFETVYLFDFIRVETLFRGALVVGLARFLGKDAILPMVALYCVLHFNKPLGETLGSIFGGYILGTIALYQRNIVGGCMVHAGVAGLMDLIAWFYR